MTEMSEGILKDDEGQILPEYKFWYVATNYLNFEKLTLDDTGFICLMHSNQRFNIQIITYWVKECVAVSNKLYFIYL